MIRFWRPWFGLQTKERDISDSNLVFSRVPNVGWSISKREYHGNGNPFASLCELSSFFTLRDFSSSVCALSVFSDAKRLSLCLRKKVESAGDDLFLGTLLFTLFSREERKKSNGRLGEKGQNRASSSRRRTNKKFLISPPPN